MPQPSTPRRPARRLLLAGLTLLTALLALSVSPVVATADAGTLAAPNFEVPFPCGQVWSGQTRTNHSPQLAVDFNRTDDTGDPVSASASGTVTVVRDLGGTSYGKYVVVDHGGGYTTLYAHLQSWTVAVGDRLDYGTRIGYVGTTGGSTGPHLHYEQRLNGSAITVRFDGSSALYYGTRNYTSSNECGANLYSSRDLCGSGYNVIDSAGLVSGGISYGKVYLLYNSSNSYNCVVTLKHRSLGTASATSAYLEPAGATRVTDSGSFGWYAGPVRKHAPGCVKWGGAVSGVAYNSPSEHCG